MHHLNCLYASLFALPVAALPANTFNTPCVPRYQIPGAGFSSQHQTIPLDSGESHCDGPFGAASSGTGTSSRTGVSSGTGATPAAPPASSSIPQASTAPSSSGTIVPQHGGDRKDNEESGGKSGDDNTSGGTATASTASTAATCNSNSTTAGSVGNTGGSETSSGFSSQNSSPPLQNTPRIQGLQPKLLLPATAVFMQTLRQSTARAVSWAPRILIKPRHQPTGTLPACQASAARAGSSDGTNINGDGSKGSLIGTAHILVMIDITCAKDPSKPTGASDGFQSNQDAENPVDKLGSVTVVDLCVDTEAPAAFWGHHFSAGQTGGLAVANLMQVDCDEWDGSLDRFSSWTKYQAVPGDGK